mgnify:CR=1 FL=1
MYTVRLDLNIDEKRLVELTDSKAAPNVVDEDVVTALQEKADRIVDGYCSKYLTPFAQPPELVRQWAVAIWRYKVYAHRPEMPVPPTIAKDYDDAIRELRDVRDGKTILDAPQRPSSQPPATTTAGGLIPRVKRLFGRGQDGLG